MTDLIIAKEGRMPSSSGSYISANGLVKIDWYEGKSVIKLYVNKDSK